MQLQRYQRIISPSLTILVCTVLLQTSFFVWLSDVGLDILFTLRGERQTSQAIVIVGIDEQSLQELGAWPFPRQIHARLLKKLCYAKSIGFDLIFSYEDEGDQAFANAIKESQPPVVLAAASDYQGKLLGPPAVLRKDVQLGHIETELGANGVVRRMEISKFELPVFPLAMTKQTRASYHRSSEKGRLINFYGPEFTFLSASYKDVLSGQYKPEFFRDRYVMVGSMALALGDAHITPYSRKHPVPGVEIQATILNNLLDDSYLRESGVVTSALCLLLLAVAALLWPKLSEAKNLSLNFILVVIGFGGSLWLFHANYYFNPLVFIFVITISYIFHVVVQWASLTTRVLREIRLVNSQLDHGIQTVFQSLPGTIDNDSLLRETTSLAGPGGLKRHILRIHKGISALALQNSFIKHLLGEEAPPLVLWQKERGTIILANERFIKLWERMSESGGEPPNLEEFYTLIRSKKIEDQGGGVAFELKSSERIEDCICDICVRDHGRKVYLRIMVNEVNSEILGLEAILAGFTDVTEIRELERLKGEVMNIVSHELKLPLTTIMGYSEMLSDSLSGVEKEYAEEISKQSKRLATMIEDFLHIARIESGKYVINRYPFDLPSVVYDAATVVGHAARNKGVEVVYNLPEKVSPIVGDEALVTQAILNLLDNAVKFGPNGSKVHIVLVEKEDHLLLQIKDEGPGVAEEEKKRIFEKFIRGKKERKGGGFGLGLSFVKKVVDSHGGKIWVEDSAPKGAVFSIALPKSGYKTI